MPKIIGIDFGYTYSVVSIWDAHAKVAKIIPNLEGESTTPSVVGLNERGDVIVGAEAKRNYFFDPCNSVWQIKREMGSEYGVCLGEGKTFSPPTIAAHILRYLKMSAERYLDEPVCDAVITIPSYFDQNRQNAVREAGIRAGLNVSQLIEEPKAVVIGYGVDTGVQPGKSQAYLVYDLGGSTFDVSVVEITEKEMTVIGRGGDPRLGGLDMDTEMMNWTLRQIKETRGIDFTGDMDVPRWLMLSVEGIKKQLVMNEAADMNLHLLREIKGQPFNWKLSITRNQFELLIQRLLDRSMVCVGETVENVKRLNNCDWKDLEGVLLAGGPTRLQKIRDMLRGKLVQKFEEQGYRHKAFEVKSDLNPDEVKAMGAAKLAASLTPIGKPPKKIMKNENC